MRLATLKTILAVRWSQVILHAQSLLPEYPHFKDSFETGVCQAKFKPALVDNFMRGGELL